MAKHTKTTGEDLSEIYARLEDILWKLPDEEKLDLTRAGFQGACKIFLSALMDKMWEEQERKNIPFHVRREAVKYFAQSLRSLTRQATGIDPADFYK